MQPNADPLDAVREAILKAVEARDTYTRLHMARTAESACRVARRLGLSESQQQVIHCGALLHDSGKIGVPDHILNKPGRLSSYEFDVMKAHPVIGQHICGPMQPSPALIRVIRNHHERLDGTGYPDGLRGDQIPMATRIVCVTEIYDALSSNRPYRPAMGRDRVCDVLRQEAHHGWWDIDVVEATLAETEARPAKASSAA